MHSDSAPNPAEAGRHRPKLVNSDRIWPKLSRARAKRPNCLGQCRSTSVDFSKVEPKPVGFAQSWSTPDRIWSRNEAELGTSAAPVVQEYRGMYHYGTSAVPFAHHWHACVAPVKHVVAVQRQRIAGIPKASPERTSQSENPDDPRSGFAPLLGDPRSTSRCPAELTPKSFRIKHRACAAPAAKRCASGPSGHRQALDFFGATCFEASFGAAGGASRWALRGATRAHMRRLSQTRRLSGPSRRPPAPSLVPEHSIFACHSRCFFAGRTNSGMTCGPCGFLRLEGKQLRTCGIIKLATHGLPR